MEEFKANLPTKNNFRQRLKIIKELGRGAFGVTSLVQDRLTGLQMAMKDAVYTTSSDREWIVADYLHNIIDPQYKSQIPEVYTHFEYKTRIDGEVQHRIIILQQLVPGVSLQKLIQQQSYPVDIRLLYHHPDKLYTRSNPTFLLDDKTIVNIAHQLFELIGAIHDKGHGIAHNDLTLNNIMWDNEKVYLVDLGISCVLTHNTKVTCYTTRLISNLIYVHPDFYAMLHNGVKPNSKQLLQNDIWEASISIYNLLLGTREEKYLITPGGKNWSEWLDNVKIFKQERLGVQKGILRVTPEFARLETAILNNFQPLDQISDIKTILAAF